jgi:Putative prokaryotic signal transducing protein
MKICAYCGTKNPDDATMCEGCGREDFENAKRDEEDSADELDDLPPIKSKLIFEPLNPKEMNKDWVTLVNCTNLMEADIIVSHLEVADIPTFTPDEFAAQITPFSLKGAGLVRVQVSPKDYEAAKEYLSAFENESVEDGDESSEESQDAV